MIILTKKFLTAAFLIVAMLLIGCGDSAENNDASNTAQASPVANKVPAFMTITVNGDTVTNEIFAAKKITVVNIWGTFCPPCIAEMPELGEMARTLPADAQVVGLVCNVSADEANMIQKARQILNKAGADFVNIVPEKQLMNFISGVEAVPTTIFVNSKGEVVGKAIIGANVKGYKDELEKLLKQ